ncbi:hypothetical protein pb186bvf_009933 [Paramecium bursaria]
MLQKQQGRTIKKYGKGKAQKEQSESQEPIYNHPTYKEIQAIPVEQQLQLHCLPKPCCNVAFQNSQILSMLCSRLIHRSCRHSQYLPPTSNLDAQIVRQYINIKIMDADGERDNNEISYIHIQLSSNSLNPKTNFSQIQSKQMILIINSIVKKEYLSYGLNLSFQYF